jgi:hypothetical protein
MPEAAIDKNRHLGRPEYDVGSAPQRFDWGRINAEA